MATNSTDTYISGARGVDAYPGIANPTEASVYSNPMETNFVSDPTDETVGAGAGESFAGHKQAARTFKETAGVVEGRPGIIESSNIDPLNENSNKDDGWANARGGADPTGVGFTSTASSVAGAAVNAATGAATAAAGAARMAYGHAVGDEAAKKAGKESLWGKQ